MSRTFLCRVYAFWGTYFTLKFWRGNDQALLETLLVVLGSPCFCTEVVGHQADEAVRWVQVEGERGKGCGRRQEEGLPGVLCYYLSIRCPVSRPTCIHSLEWGPILLLRRSVTSPPASTPTLPPAGEGVTTQEEITICFKNSLSVTFPGGVVWCDLWSRRTASSRCRSPDGTR